VRKTWVMAGVLCGAAALTMAQTAPDAQNAAPGSSAASQPASGMAKPQTDNAAAAQRPMGPAIPATLAKSVDSKKAKVGDEIDAQTSVSLSGAGVQIPEGSKIVGHITDVKSKAKGDPESSLTFAFEKIVLKDGKQLPFRAVAQAIGPGGNAATAAFPENGGPNSPPQAPAGSAAARPGNNGGTGAAAGAPGGTASNAPEGSAAPGNGGRLPENATGAVGMKGVTLTSEGSAAVISSSSKSVKLDSGTQMLLRTISQ
jgi:hypothetical protein